LAPSPPHPAAVDVRPPTANVAGRACAKATNIEAIIDDSGSKSLTDPNRLRRRQGHAPVKGKLRFTVKAARIGSGAPKVTLTTQVRQTRRPTR
jgi:hypothetical protein